MKILVLVVCCGLAWLADAAVCNAAPASRLPAATPIVQADWQDPESLPLSMRNHCAYDRLRGRMYCSDHCGFEYQAYYCSPRSFGCCRISFGYCDWNGLLRCHP